MTNIEQLLNTLAAERFFGSIEIKYENGKPVLLRKTETIKPAPAETCRDNRGESHVSQPFRK
jgi:hypothetical protein